MACHLLKSSIRLAYAILVFFLFSHLVSGQNCKLTRTDKVSYESEYQVVQKVFEKGSKEFSWEALYLSFGMSEKVIHLKVRANGDYSVDVYNNGILQDPTVQEEGLGFNIANSSGFYVAACSSSLSIHKREILILRKDGEPSSMGIMSVDGRLMNTLKSNRTEPFSGLYDLLSFMKKHQAQ